MDESKIGSGLGRIRYLQKQGRYSVPKSVTTFLKHMANNPYQPLKRLCTPQQTQEFLSMIETNMDAVLQDEVFAGQAQTLGKDFNAMQVLKLLAWMLISKKRNGHMNNKAIPLRAICKLKLDIKEAADYATSYMGETYEGRVSGITRLTCWIDGDLMFTRFISHPFYQYGSIPVKQTI